jgi:ATP-dependent DNA ligase
MDQAAAHRTGKGGSRGFGRLHEIKFDGYRLHARLDRGTVRLLTRTGLDWTYKYPVIASAVSQLEANQAYLDGELCGVRPDGTTSFSMMQAATDAGSSDGRVFFAFDLLYLDGEAISAPPLRTKRAAQNAAGECRPTAALQRSSSWARAGIPRQSLRAVVRGDRLEARRCALRAR